MDAENTISAPFYDYDRDADLDLFLGHWGVERGTGQSGDPVAATTATAPPGCDGLSGA